MAFVPVVIAGVFLEAGFVPAALTYLADVSEAFAGERGMRYGSGAGLRRSAAWLRGATQVA